MVQPFRRRCPSDANGRFNSIPIDNILQNITRNPLLSVLCTVHISPKSIIISTSGTLRGSSNPCAPHVAYVSYAYGPNRIKTIFPKARIYYNIVVILATKYAADTSSSPSRARARAHFDKPVVLRSNFRKVCKFIL